jgi:phage-related minor tail protein
MASKKTNVNVAITGDAKKFRKALKQSENDLGKFEKIGGKAFGALKTAGIGMAVGVGAAFVKAGLDFEKMEKVLIQGTGASGEALADLKEQATDVMKTVPESAETIATTIADVNTHLGLTGDELEDTSKLFLDFARVAEVDVSSAVGALDAQLTQFGMSAGDSEEVLGDLLRISQATGVPMDKLLAQMETFGPIFANANFTAEETAALLGQMEQGGVNLTRVGPALNKFFRDAAKNGKKPQKALKDTVEAIENATSTTDALNIATAAFGAEGAQRMVSLIKSGNFDLEEFNGLLGEGTGIVDDQAEATATLSDKFNVLKNKVLAELGPVAIAVMDGIMNAMTALIPVVEDIIKAVKEFFASEGFKTFAEGVGKVIGVIVDHARYMWEQIQLYFGFIIDIFKGDFAGAWDKVKEIASNAFEQGKKLGSMLIDGLMAALEAIGGAVGDLANTLADAFVGAVKWALNNIVIDPINWAISKAVDTLDVTLGPIVNFPSVDEFIPRLAEGGIVTGPTLALIGEAGPEAVVPLDGNHGMGGTNYITVNVTGVSGEEVVEAIQRETRQRGAAVFPTVGTRRL